MARVDLIMPKMGESIMEATILKWSKKVGDAIAQDETILEIATDKVDSEIPSPIAGIVVEILYPENSVVGIGKTIAIISTDSASETTAPAQIKIETEQKVSAEVLETVSKPLAQATESNSVNVNISSNDVRFYSPLVKNIAKEENISASELAQLSGTGSEGRVTKKDILTYVDNKKSGGAQLSSQNVSQQSIAAPVSSVPTSSAAASPASTTAYTTSGDNQIIEMDRMRKLIADHMVMWREKNKDGFTKKYGEKITYTPIFIEAVARAIKDFPMINVSVDGSNIIVKKNINIGMAAALPTGNLIVPVIKNADMLNLAGITKSVNDLANRARQNKLKPDEIQDGTFTVTNVGTFGNVMGTPIINQPQVAILAVGAIRKRPAVLETEQGDVIAIRHMMFLSLSYDHRVVDGFLGGSFLRRIGDYLEAFKGEVI
jgi:2-oxoglutarate dehydrogenase E2 component (dihydrolipoamide succinyltransferase)